MYCSRTSWHISLSISATTISWMISKTNVFLKFEILFKLGELLEKHQQESPHEMYREKVLINRINKWSRNGHNKVKGKWNLFSCSCGHSWNGEQLWWSLQQYGCNLIDFENVEYACICTYVWTMIFSSHWVFFFRQMH